MRDFASGEKGDDEDEQQARATLAPKDDRESVKELLAVSHEVHGYRPWHVGREDREVQRGAGRLGGRRGSPAAGAPKPQVAIARIADAGGGGRHANEGFCAALYPRRAVNPTSADLEHFMFFKSTSHICSVYVRVRSVSQYDHAITGICL